MLGDGFEHMDTEQMRDKRIMFSLSRYGDIKSRCTRSAMCNPSRYIGKQGAKTSFNGLPAVWTEYYVHMELNYVFNNSNIAKIYATLTCMFIFLCRITTDIIAISV